MIFKTILCIFVAGRNTKPYGPYLTTFWGEGRLWCFAPIACNGLPLLDFMITLTGHATVSRTPLVNSSARRRDLCLTTHNNHQRQISVPPARFKPTIPASKPPQAHTLDHAGLRGLALTIISILNMLLSYLDILLSNSYILTLPHNTKSLIKF